MKTFQTFDIEAEYDALHNRFPNHKDAPVIGITGNFSEGNLTLAPGYYTSILKAGGTPFIIPPFENTDILISLLDSLDGLLLTGGARYKSLIPERRASKRITQHQSFPRSSGTTSYATCSQPPDSDTRHLPWNASHERSTWRKYLSDIHVQMEGKRIKHSQDMDRAFASHTIQIEHDSLLARIMKTTSLPVNSFHHQAINEAAPGFRISARAADQVAEAIESTEYKSMLGVQWHPECFILNGDEYMMPLFEWLLQEATSFRTAKQMHRRILTLDTHCDTPMFFGQDINFATRDAKIKVDLHKMAEGRQDATIMVAYLAQKERTDEALLAATAKADQLLNEIERMVAMNCTAVDIAYTPADLYRLKREGKKAIMLGIENGYAIGKDLTNVERFRNRGVVYMTLCHNGNNDICGSARYNDEYIGVTPFGEQVIREMNRIGMMVDLSHAGEQTFYDTLDISSKPVVCSHSSSRALCDHPRNLTDEQLKAIARKGGVVQVCLYSGFLRTDAPATICDAIEHLHHMVNIMGIEHVGIGTDFDGDGGIIGCNDSSELINLTRRMLYERYSENDLRLIWGGNFLRVMEEVQKQD